MKDSKGNKFTTGDILVSTEAPDSDPGILCKSITDGLANFQWRLGGFDPPFFLLKPKIIGY